jgi:hypothetical protein
MAMQNRERKRWANKRVRKDGGNRKNIESANIEVGNSKRENMVQEQSYIVWQYAGYDVVFGE